MIARLQSLLDQEQDLRIAVVYGSFATGKQNEASDVDLAVAFGRSLSDDDKADLVTRLSAALGRELDLIDLRTATGTVLKEALTQGVVLVQRDSDLLAFIIKRMILDEEDFQRTRRQLLAERRKKIFGMGSRGDGDVA